MSRSLSRSAAAADDGLASEPVNLLASASLPWEAGGRQASKVASSSRRTPCR